MRFETALQKPLHTVTDLTISYLRSPITEEQINAALPTFTALERLYISTDLKTLTPDIATLTQLQSLTIQSDQLTALPKTLGQLCALQSLSIRSRLLKALPEQLGELQQLQHLRLSGCTHLHQLPACLADLPFLETISIYNGAGLDLSIFQKGFPALKRLILFGIPLEPKQLASLGQLPELRQLHLNHCQLTELPEDIVRLSQLTSLSLSNNQLTTLPEAALLQLTDLQYVDLAHNQLSQFPTFLKALPTLKGLDWVDNAYPVYPKALLEFPTAVVLRHLKGKEAKACEAILEQAQTFSTQPATQALYLALQSHAPLQEGAYTRADFMALFEVGNKAFHSQVLDQLLAYEAARLEQRPLTQDAVVAVVGKPTKNKNDIRRILKEKGIAYQTSITLETTHLLVGSTGIKDFGALANPEHILVSDQAFQAFANAVEQPYLLEAAQAESWGHISALLLSTNAEQQAVGVELLQGGGLPKALATELFVVYKFTADKKLAAKAKKMLQGIASTALLEKLKLRINLSTIKDAYQAKGKIEQFVEGTELLPWKIARYAYHYHPKVWGNQLAMMLDSAPEAVLAEHLATLIQADSNPFLIKSDIQPYLSKFYQQAKGITSLKIERMNQGLTGIAQLEQLEELSFYFINDLVLPEDLHQVPQLSHIEFVHTTLAHTNWEVAIAHLSQLPALRQLRFWKSMSLGLPPNMQQLQALEILVCMQVAMDDAAIQQLAQLPRLQHLELDDCMAHLSDAFSALTGVVSLHFARTTTYTVSSLLSELTQLRHLSLSGGFQVEMALDLPQLEVLTLDSNYKSKATLAPNALSPLKGLKRLICKTADLPPLSVLKELTALEYLEFRRIEVNLDELIEGLRPLKHFTELSAYIPPHQMAKFTAALPHVTVR